MVDCRRATDADADTVRTLWVGAAQRLQARGIAQWRADDFTPAWVAQRIAGGEVWVGEIDGTPVGVLRLLDADPTIWPDDVHGEALYLHSLAADRDCVGAGAMLLAFAEAETRRQGRAFLRLDCWAGNERLIRYYRDAGFEPCGVHREADWEVLRFEKSV